MSRIALTLVALTLPVIKRDKAQWGRRQCQAPMVKFATDRSRRRMKASKTGTAVSTLIAAALSLAAGTVGSSPVYAKDYRVHSLLRPVIYAQATSQRAMQATRRAAEAESGWFYEPTNRNGEVINYADYQRGGTN